MPAPSASVNHKATSKARRRYKARNCFVANAASATIAPTPTLADSKDSVNNVPVAAQSAQEVNSLTDRAETAIIERWYNNPATNIRNILVQRASSRIEASTELPPATSESIAEYACEHVVHPFENERAFNSPNSMWYEPQRCNAYFVKAVELLGSEAVNDRFSKVVVDWIPQRFHSCWAIHEYDGWERVDVMSSDEVCRQIRQLTENELLSKSNQEFIAMIREWKEFLG